jgi:hypothetical protein
MLQIQDKFCHCLLSGWFSYNSLTLSQSSCVACKKGSLPEKLRTAAFQDKIYF